VLILASLRTRWSGLISGFLALTAGVALVAAMGIVLAGTFDAPARPPQRYATARAVVAPVDELAVDTPHGVRTQPLAVPRGITADTAARVAATGTVVVDRVGYAQLSRGGADQVGRPWAAAAFGAHRLRTGRAPAADDEIVVWAGGAEPGARVTVRTDSGTRPYTVVGVLAPARFERALLFTDAEAARIFPRVDALIVDASPERVRAAAGTGGRVYAGQRLRRFDPDAARDAEALVAANSLVGTAGGIAAFVSAFVVAGTFAYAVAQRRRELALLRTAGATPGQVRRMVLGEGLAVGLLAAAAGCVLGQRAAPHIAAWLVERGFAPDWFTVPDSRAALVVAFGSGMAAALGGVWTAARRAGRIRPVEALRESTVEDRTTDASPGRAVLRSMTLWRWLWAVALLGGALVTTFGPVVAAPADALKRKQYVPSVLLLVVAFAVLAPVLVGPAARLVGGPLVRLRGATGLLVRESALAAARRTAATAAPVLLTVGLAACLLGITATIARAEADAERVPGAYAVEPDGTPGIGPDAVARLRAVPDAEVAVSYPTTVYDLEEGVALLRRTAHTVDPGALRGLPLLAGSVDGLADDTIVVDREWGRGVGDTVRIWRADGSPVTLRVVAVLREGLGGTGAFLTLRHPAEPLADRVIVRPRPGADPAAVAAAVRAATDGLGAALTEPVAETGGVKETGIRAVLGLALLYAGLSVAGTMLMAARERAHDLELLRLAGAGVGQRLRVVAGEALFVVAVGVTLALGTAVLAVGALCAALLRLTGTLPVPVLPWGTIGAVVAATAAVATGTSLLATGASVRGTFPRIPNRTRRGPGTQPEGPGME
jgi:putative ABC transport system permease protein